MMRLRSIVARGAVCGLLFLVGCGGPSASPKAAPTDLTTSTRPTTTEPATSTTTTPLPTGSPYQPGRSEREPRLKTAAARFLESATTYARGDGTAKRTAARLVDAGLSPNLADQIPALLKSDAESVGRVIYPQLAGISPTQASVITVIRQTFRAGDGKVTTVTRTVDVRLDNVKGAWTVTGVASTGGAPPPTVTSSPLARQVLDSPRLSMSDSARWDVGAGRIDDRLLGLLLTLSEKNTLRITVFATGHPFNVFGTPRVSNHTQGRAVDIWAVDGRPVMGATPNDAAYAVVAAALALGATELGSPWDLDGAGKVSFANALHADHLHLAYDA